MSVRLLIIVINYNNSEGLLGTLESINLQSVKKNCDVACFDGASSDTSVNVAKSFLDKLNLLLFSEKDSGIYNAMNKGLNYFMKSNSTHVMFLNSGDSFSSSDSLSLILSSISNDSVVKFFRTKNMYSDLYNYRPSSEKKLKLNRFDSDYFPCHQAIIFPKSTIGNLVFDESFKISADTVFIEKILNSHESEYIPTVVVNFELGGISSFYTSFTHFLLHYSERVRSKPMLSRRYRLQTFLKLLTKYFLGKILGKYLYFKLYLK